MKYKKQMEAPQKHIKKDLSFRILYSLLISLVTFLMAAAIFFKKRFLRTSL